VSLLPAFAGLKPHLITFLIAFMASSNWYPHSFYSSRFVA
jgi:hypothetical protein